MQSGHTTFSEAIDFARHYLYTYGVDINRGRWQGVRTEGRPDMVTREIINFQADIRVGRMQDGEAAPLDAYPILLAGDIRPNLPWANDHFEERVSRVPSNPGEEYKNWPWWRGQDTEAMDGQVFSHTYQERFWPKYAGDPWYDDGEGSGTNTQRGIRYEYGDLDDVVSLLLREPLGRQATFPIFFPEDTGVVHEGRVPCTLHYSFLVTPTNRLDMWYPIRSCDYIRHLRDDLYMAARLQLWVLTALRTRSRFERDGIDPDFSWATVTPGDLHFTAYSLHVHKGDWHHFMKEVHSDRA